jgi:hypothetical protein
MSIGEQHIYLHVLACCKNDLDAVVKQSRSSEQENMPLPLTLDVVVVVMVVMVGVGVIVMVVVTVAVDVVGAAVVSIVVLCVLVAVVGDAVDSVVVDDPGEFVSVGGVKTVLVTVERLRYISVDFRIVSRVRPPVTTASPLGRMDTA